LRAVPAFAEGEAAPDALATLTAAASDLRIGIDTVWVLVTAMLVFWMNAGFALVESGLCQAKNTTNILGWFGFNPGSTMAAMNGMAISHILVATNMAAAAGALGATIAAWVLLGKLDLSIILNGCLAGLVAVSAPCAFVSIGASALIGLVGGVIAVLAVVAFDKVKVDDPVGALSVHLVNGVWGTLALASARAMASSPTPATAKP
jgi:ammonia channel protein AmtB